MPLLRAALAAEGFGYVAVRGHTGNAVLTSPLPREEVAARATAVCERELGFRKDIHVVSGDEWTGLVNRNPFPGAAGRPSTLHVAVLGAEPDPTRVAALGALGDGSDSLRVMGRVAYIHAPEGFSRSRIATRFDRGIGVSNTARNWATVQKILALVEAADAAEAA
jgi:uncharacterized protein (DUF1697 family)